MHLYGRNFIIVSILLFGTTTAQHDIDVESTDVKDALIRMERKLGTMEARLESVERELKAQKEVNIKLTLNVEDLQHQLSSNKQNVICSRCMKKAPFLKKSATTYFNKIVSQPNQTIQSKQPTQKTSDQYGIIHMLMKALKKQENRIIALETACSQTPSKVKEYDESPSVGNATTAHVHYKRLKEGNTNKPDRSVATGVAFTAYLDHALTNIGVDHIIQMRGIVLNEGNGYNQYTGIFSTPLAGVYMFSYAIVDYHIHSLRVNLLVNGEKRVGAITYPRYNGYYQHGGNLAILRLAAGESVWLAVAESGDNIYGTPEYRYSTFSGVFLYA